MIAIKDSRRVITTSAGTSYLDNNGDLHSENDRPAFVARDSTHEWYHHGKLHRDHAPAIVRFDGSEVWYQHGLIHRSTGAAWRDHLGTEVWYHQGIMHRLDGPAVIYQLSGMHRWFVHGEEITSMVELWEQTVGKEWPWDPSTQALFVLTWG